MIIYDKVAVIGIGLVGASVAIAAKHKKLASQISCYDLSASARDEARALGIGHDVCDSMKEAVAEADFVIMAVPVGAMQSVMEEMAAHLKPQAVITDTGSTKRSVIRDVSPFVPDDCYFIPSHPMAGTEFSGPSAGFASLFEGRYWLVVPDGAPRPQIDQMSAFLSKLGAMVEEMDAHYHDRVVAITSHLPHLIAYTIVGTAVDLESDLKEDVIRFSASGFRDFTRIAASDPVMWRDVFLNNDEAVLEMLQRFNEDLSYLQRAIRWQEGDKLFELFTRTRSIRKSIIEAGQD